MSIKLWTLAALAAGLAALAFEPVREAARAAGAAVVSSAYAQSGEDPDDDDDDDDEDEGGDAVGEDDLGNDGAGGDDMGGDDPAGDDAGDDDMAGDDGAAGDDDGPSDDGPGDDGGASGGSDDEGGGDDDDGGAATGSSGGDDDDDDDARAPGAPTGGARQRGARDDDDAPGGAGVRGVSAGGDVRVRDGDSERGRPDRLPAGVDLDGEGRWVRAGEILALETDAEGLAEARAQGFVVIERTPLQSLGTAVVRLKAPEGRVLSNAISQLRALDPDNAYDFNHIYRTAETVAPRRARAAAPAPTAKAAPKPAAATGPLIGMIDSAVAANHPALRSVRIEQKDFVRAGGARPTEHGTAVASLLAGDDRPTFAGGAPGARLLAGSVVGPDAGGAPLAAAEAMVRALDWMTAAGAPVVNVSLAGPPNALVEEAIRRAQAKGVIVVAAVGNDGPAAPPRYPAAYEGVVGVTAVDGQGGIYRRAARGAHVDVAALGVAVTAAGPPARYEPKTGTSFAAPRVAADIARRHARPDPVSAQKALTETFATAKAGGGRGKDPIYGAGILDLDGAN